MEDFDDNDLDNIVDHHLDGNEHFEEQLEQGDQEQKDDEKRIVPVKIRVKKPQAKLNAQR